MPSFSGREPRGKGAKHKTLADLLFRFEPLKLRQELEEYRVDYESKFGETDLAQRFTSTWAIEDQKWLLKNYPLRYWRGLPPFVKAFILEKMHAAKSEGILDDMPASLLQLYLTGKMNLSDGTISPE